MNERLGRRIGTALLSASILILATASVGAQAASEVQDEMRLVVRLPFAEQGVPGAPRALLDQVIAIYRRRLDPTGKRELSIAPQGEERVVIELPTIEAYRARPTAALASSIEAGAGSLELAMERGAEGKLQVFPTGGGAIAIDGELALYGQRLGNRLVGLTRGSTDQAKPHAAGAPVTLVVDESLRGLLTSRGELRFAIEASDQQFTSAGTELAREKKEVVRWMESHPGAANLDEYNALPRELGGPPAHPSIRWCTQALELGREVPFAERPPIALSEEENPAWHFGGADLAVEKLGETADDMGMPAIAFRLQDARASVFGDFTEAHVNELLAIVFDGEILTMPKIKTRLPGGGIIQSGGLDGFSAEHVQELILLLRAGSLPVRPQIESMAVREK